MDHRNCWDGRGNAKRKQVSRACLNCQKAHSGCGEQRPCPRCVKRKEEHKCIDAPRRKKDPIPTATTPVKTIKKRKKRCASGGEALIAGVRPCRVVMKKRPRRQKWHAPRNFMLTFPFVKPEETEPLEEEVEYGQVDSNRVFEDDDTAAIFGSPAGGSPMHHSESEPESPQIIPADTRPVPSTEACPFYFDLNTTFDMLHGLQGEAKHESAGQSSPLDGVQELVSDVPGDVPLEWLISPDLYMWEQEIEAAHDDTPLHYTGIEPCEALFPLRGF